MPGKSRARARAPELFAEPAIPDDVVPGQIAVAPASDVEATLTAAREAGVRAAVVMLDPWYNKGVGGVRADYAEFIARVLALAGAVGDHVFLWGFPEIVALFVANPPGTLSLTAWLTWYYKNNPSVIRGWRSAQMACLHFSNPGARMYPEHFLNEAQLERLRAGTLRYMPGPTSVIEASLLVGFVGRAEQTGHPSQKPLGAIDPLLKMTTKPGDLVIDPMCGSGTTGASARRLGVSAILADADPRYAQLSSDRLEVPIAPALSSALAHWVAPSKAEAA